MTATEQLYKMLTENTGSHFLDSGGAYGRHHERNANKTLEDFENEPSVTWEVYNNELDMTISVFHYLNNQLDLDDLCIKFNELNESSDNWDSELFYGVSKEAEEMLMQVEEIDEDNLRINNSYNYDSRLSQVIQYTNFVLNDEYYVMLQIHQGCDVRGGYTNAKMFKLDNDYDYDNGYMNSEDVYGVIDNIQVDTSYNGWSLTTEEGEEVKVSDDSNIELYLGY